MPALIALAILSLIEIDPAQAHGDEGPLSSTWTFDPWIISPLGLAVVAYSRGAHRLYRRARQSRTVVRWRAAAFGAGSIALAAALISPLHWLGEQLFTFHMVEHEILMAAAAPLIVLARPIGALMWGLPLGLRRAIARAMNSRFAQVGWEWLSRGLMTTSLHAIAIWAWHVPVLFDAAVINAPLHRLQHLSFFATAVLFWWSALWRSDRGVAAWHLFLTMLHTSILGALMALAPRVLYLAQTRAAEDWGLTPLEDQQLAGVVMWIPAGTVYAGVALTLFAMWIAGSGRSAHHVVSSNLF
jgi:putative membrane protein